MTRLFARVLSLPVTAFLWLVFAVAVAWSAGQALRQRLRGRR